MDSSLQTISAKYYAYLLDRLNDEIKKRRHLAKKDDNAPAYSQIVAAAKIQELNFELLSHLPYSPDLTSKIDLADKDLKTMKTIFVL